MKILLTIMLMLISLTALAVENYTVTKSIAEMTAPADTNVLVESNTKGAWWGFIRSEPDLYMPEEYISMYMRFEFRTENYFSKENQGHIAIGIRGSGYTGLLGRGIILGNVSALYGDSATSQPSAIAIESFWNTGNAVYGKATESVVLENSVNYRITISSEGKMAETISYILEKRVEDGWVEIASRKIVDYKGIGKADSSLGGWFIAEVFSTHAWSYKISNLQVWYD